MRRLAIGSVSFLLIAALLAPAGIAAPPDIPDHVEGYTIIPAGQDGFANLAQAQGHIPHGPHTTDQLAMYAAFIKDETSTMRTFPRCSGITASAPPGPSSASTLRRREQPCTATTSGCRTSMQTPTRQPPSRSGT